MNVKVRPGTRPCRLKACWQAMAHECETLIRFPPELSGLLVA